MVKRIKARKMGGSVGAPLPKEMVERLHIQEGDDLVVVETRDGILISPYDPTFDQAIETYKRGARTYQNALRKLSE